MSHAKLDFSSVSQIDYTVLQGLQELATDLNSQGVEMHIINPQPQIRRYLIRAKLEHINIQDTLSVFPMDQHPRVDSDPTFNLIGIRRPTYNSIP